MSGNKIYSEDYCAACYFRTIAEYPNRKCLIQLTEKCNLQCKHCFADSNRYGDEMEFEKIESCIVPQLKKSRITKVTLTGGEPFVYDRLSDAVRLLSDEGISVCICTNATLITDSFLSQVQDCRVHFNVSLDGFSASSHGRFRGNEAPEMFERIKGNIKLLGEKGFLNGILVTPNTYAKLSEYVSICDFAQQCGAKYVLMNPLSQFGRGEKGISVALASQQMEELRTATCRYNSEHMEMVYIRFPNETRKPLGECVAGKIMYIFTNGDIAYCPYMVFAARNSASKYDASQFVMGNIFENGFDWETAIKSYRFPVNYDEVCAGCSDVQCRRGCFAAKIARGESLTGADVELCPSILRNV